MLGVALDAVQLVDVVEGTRRRRLVTVVETRSTNIHEATLRLMQRLSVPAAVVVRQLVRGNAIAHVVFVPRCNKKPRNRRPRRCVLNEISHSLQCSHAASDAWRATVAVDQCEGGVGNCDVRQPWSLMRVKTACACCARPNRTQGHKQWRCLAKNSTQAQWPLRREDACVLRDPKEAVQLLGGAAPSWRRRGADIDLLWVVRRDQQTRVSCEIQQTRVSCEIQRLPCDRGSRLAGVRLWAKKVEPKKR